MPFNATVVSIMISSPSDVIAEHSIVKRLLDEWNILHAKTRQVVLLPRSWQTHASPSMEGRAQAIINKQVLEDSDLLVAIFWTRIGTPTGEAQSGTVEEIEEHLARGKRALIYFSTAPVQPDNIEQDQYDAVQQFRKECQSRGLYESYSDHADFEEKLRRQLHQAIEELLANAEPSDNPQVPIAVAPPQLQTSPELDVTRQMSDYAKTILSSAASDNGTVLRIRTLGGEWVQAGKQSFPESRGDARETAMWVSGLEELLHLGLIADRGYKGEMFMVTGLGYKVADLM